MIVPLTPLDFRRRVVHLFPDQTCVVDGDIRYNYRQFDERINRLANGLRQIGLRPGEVVSFINFNTYHLLEAYYGVVQAGGVLNPINIRLNARDITYILNHAETSVLCYHYEFRPLVEQMQSDLQTVRTFVEIEPTDTPPEGVYDWEQMLADASPNFAAEPILDENEVCEIFYTSGTTGRPKGVTLTHRTLYLHAIYAIASIRLNWDDAILHIVPLFHINGWGTPHFLTAVGGKHVMLRQADPGRMCELIEQERVTRLFAVPTVFSALLNFPDLDKYDLSSLREVVMGGAPAATSLIQAAEEEFGCLAHSAYGLTETSPILVWSLPKPEHRHLPQTERWRQQTLTGWEILGVDLRIVRPDGTDVEPNGEEPGEVIVRSNVVMEGYLRDGEATAEVVRDGWFHTGDIATINASRIIRIVDRKKDVIISGGENISSVEVEQVLCDHPAVLECAVIGVPDETWGEMPLALVTLKLGALATEEDLMAHCRENLSHFKCPKRIEFRDELTKGGTGKIQKRALREPYWQGYDRRVH